MTPTEDIHHKPTAASTVIHRKPVDDKISTATPLLKTDKAGHVPQGWPTSPKRVKSSILTIVSNSAFDIVLLAFSVAFLAFALIVYHYNQAPTAKNQVAKSRLEDAVKYGPTIFPILFASIVGRATHSILLWRLEKGERVRILDTLATSTSLTSTVTSQIQMRIISILGVVLVAIWAFSPVGGQASIRQMSIGTRVTTEPASFQYVVQDGGIFGYQSSDSYGHFIEVNGLFMGAIMAPWQTRTSPLDWAGNVKIPKIEHYEKTSKPDSEGWYSTSQDNDDNNDNALNAYTSFVGIPIDGNKSNVTTTDYQMRIHTPYLYLQCTYSPDGWGPNVNPPENAMNQTGQGAYVWWTEEGHNRAYVSLHSLKPFKFNFVGIALSLNSCTVESTYVETEVFCAANSTCRAIKMRRSQLPSLPPAWTFLDKYGFDWTYLLKGFMLTLGDMKGSPTWETLLEKYLRDPHLNSVNFGSTTPNITDEQYSHRLGQLLNSYYACMTSVYTLTGGINNNTSHFWDTNITFVPPLVTWNFENGSQQIAPADQGGSYNWTSDQFRTSRVWPTEGTKSVHTEVIVANKIWVALLAIASMVLIISSLVSPFLRYFVQKGPDVAVNFSSLAIRNNAYVCLPTTGTFLDAADRARLLGNVKVRFGDLDGNAEVGSLALASCSVEEFSTSRARKGRLYE